MNLEEIDGIVKLALFARATSLLQQIGGEVTNHHIDDAADLIAERERTLKLLHDEAERQRLCEAIRTVLR